MKLHCGTFLGVPLYLHWTLLLFFILLFFWQGAFVVAVSASVLTMVVLHEYGHCAAARYFNIIAEDVTLYPFGGIARMKFNTGNAKEEFVIALAGPMVNIVLFFVFWLAYIFIVDQAVQLVLFVLIYINLVIVIFNLLPMLPLDGGRIVRSLMICFMEYCKATLIIVRISQVLAVAMAVAGLFINPIWTVIAFIIFMGAQIELVEARHFACIQIIKKKVAIELNRPELVNCTLPELIEVLEKIEFDESRKVFYQEELVPLLREMKENNTFCFTIGGFGV